MDKVLLGQLDNKTVIDLKERIGALLRMIMDIVQ